MKLQKKSGLITGASSGLGYFLAKKWILEGHRLVVTGRNEAQLRELKSISPSQVESIPGDLLDAQFRKDLALATNSFLSDGMDFLFYSAGQAHLGLAKNIPVQKFRDSFELQVISLLDLVVNLTPLLEVRKSQVVVVSSGSAYRGLPGSSPYCTSKAAQLSLLESLAVELKPKGIDIKVISPGLMQTEFQAHSQVYGSLPFDFTNNKKTDLDSISLFIEKSMNKPGFHFEISFISMAARLLNGLFPELLNKILYRKVNNK